jgi:hypothetical protein
VARHRARNTWSVQGFSVSTISLSPLFVVLAVCVCVCVSSCVRTSILQTLLVSVYLSFSLLCCLLFISAGLAAPYCFCSQQPGSDQFVPSALIRANYGVTLSLSLFPSYSHSWPSCYCHPYLTMQQCEACTACNLYDIYAEFNSNEDWCVAPSRCMSVVILSSCTGIWASMAMCLPERPISYLSLSLFPCVFVCVYVHR